MVYGKKNNTHLFKKHRNLDRGIDFIYVTLILFFFMVNHKLPNERNRKLPNERNRKLCTQAMLLSRCCGKSRPVRLGLFSPIIPAN